MTSIQRFFLGLIVMFRLVRANARGEGMGVAVYESILFRHHYLCH